MNMTTPSEIPARARGLVCKVNDALGVVFGYGIVCKTEGNYYYDLQGDHIPEDEMLKAVIDFMKRVPTAKVMHEGDEVGRVLLSMPLTTEIAASFGLATTKTGWLVGWMPYDKQLIKRFQPGPAGEPPELTGFSIGGTAESHEVSP